MAQPIIRFHPRHFVPTRCLRCGRAGAHLGQHSYRARVPATKFWTTYEHYRVLRAPRRMCFGCDLWSGRHLWMFALITLFVCSAIGLGHLPWSASTTISVAAFLPLVLAFDRIFRFRVVKVAAVEPDGIVALRNVHPDTVAELVAGADTVKGMAQPVARVV